MPGTIHVSVLGFKGLSISSIQIKASMGKKEFQIWEKGDFSFPLTTLRDNLIITLLDAEGDEISHAGVRTMSIVEKVVWDDLFPLEGGGHIHMKLQFVLSDEERNRIRLMREMALKKKQMELLNSSLGVASNSTSFLPTNEVSDSRMSSITPYVLTNAGDVAVRADDLPKSDIVSKNGESHNANKEGTIQRVATPNAEDRKDEKASSSPVSEGAGVLQKPLVDKVENELPRPNIQVGPILSQETSSSFVSSEAVIAENKLANSRLGNDQDEKTEEQSPVDKIDEKEKSEGTEIPMIDISQTPQVQHADISTRKEIKFPESKDNEKTKSVFPKVSDENKRLQKAPSNIRKMISAFESSLAQESGPATKSLAVKSQSNRIGMVRLLKDQVFKGVTEMSESSSRRLENPAISSLGRLKNSFSAGDLQRIPANILKKGEATTFQKDFGDFKSSQAVNQFKESSGTKSQPKGMDTSFLKDELGQAQIDIIPKKFEKMATEEATFSGRKNEERNPAEKLVMSELKLALREKTEKKMEKYKLPSPLEEATLSGRMHKERNSAGASIEKNEFGSNKEVNTKELAARSDSITNNEVSSVNKDTNTNEVATSDSMRPSTFEAANVSGNIHGVGERDSGGTSFVKQEIVSSQKETNKKGTEMSPGDSTSALNLEAGALPGPMGIQQDSSGKLVVDSKGKRISSTKKSNETNIQGVPKDVIEYFPSEISGTWIFPDDRSHSCITAEGDKVTNSWGGVVEENRDQRNKIHDEPGITGKDLVQCGTDGEVKNTEEESNASRNSEQERSRDDASTGPLGQIIKIAVVIGFGLLVLLTRQRQPRKAKRKENDPPFGIESFIDQKISIEEHLKKIDIF